MPVMSAARSCLLIVDFQGRLMPAIFEAGAALRNAGRLIAGAGLLGIPHLYTEQNPKGLGTTAPELLTPDPRVLHKMTFDSTRADGVLAAIGAADTVVVAGCEAHVCVLQTVLGLLKAGKAVFVVRDAIGARRLESKETAIARMERHGAQIVTTEMVLFEWLESAAHPRFREVIALIR